MNTNAVLSGFTVDTLQGYLNDSKTWVEFKLKCGLPKSRRQDGVRAYLDDHKLDYSHLPSKGQSGMQQKSEVWAIPSLQFQEYVAESQNWTELLQACGFEGLGNIRTVRRRIKNLEINVDHFKIDTSNISARILQTHLDNSTSWREFAQNCGFTYRGHGALRTRLDELGIDYSHLNKKYDVSIEEILADNVKVARPIILKLLLTEREYVCSKCAQSEWEGQPIPLKVHHLNRKPRDNRRENLTLMCPNCIVVSKRSPHRN